MHVQQCGSSGSKRTQPFWYAWCAATSLSILLQATVVCAAPLLRVRAKVRIDLHAAQLADSVRIRGTVLDDQGAPLARRALQVWLQPMSPSGHAQTRTLQSDAAGTFATTFSAATSSNRLQVAFEGDAFYERTEATQTVDVEHNELQLAFVAAANPWRIQLDQPQTRIQLRASSASGGGALPVSFEDELARSVAFGTTSEDGTLALDVATERLGEPGLGTLSAISPGDATRVGARTTQSILRTRTSRLTLRAQLEAATRQLRLTVTLTTQAGPLSQKAVGVFLDDVHLITLLTERDGTAHRRLHLPTAISAGTHRVSARFDADGPGWTGSRSGAVSFAIAPEAPLNPAWLIVPVLASLAFALRPARRAIDHEAQGDVPRVSADIRFGAAGRGRAALYALDGHVEDGDSGLRLAARLTLNTDSAPLPRLVSADAEGRFACSTLPAGSYQVQVLMPGYAPAAFNLRVPHAGTGMGIRVALRSLRSAALDAHAPVARRVLRSEASLQRATVRDTLRAAVSGTQPSAALQLLTDLVERVAYGRGTPDERDLAAVQRAATDAIADLEHQASLLGDPKLGQ